MEILITWLINALAILAAAYIIPSVKVDGFVTALILALVLGIINAFLKPILVIITLPITILTLGIFLLVINALIVMLADKIVPGFESGGFWNALIFSIVLTIINLFVGIFD